MQNPINSAFDLDMNCGANCFIHEHFQLKLIQDKKCKCGLSFPDPMQNAPNNFQFIVHVEGGDTGFISQCNLIMDIDENYDPRVTRTRP